MSVPANNRSDPKNVGKKVCHNFDCLEPLHKLISSKTIFFNIYCRKVLYDNKKNPIFIQLFKILALLSSLAPKRIPLLILIKKTFNP